MPGKKLNKIKFLSISRDVKTAVAEKNYNAVEIARKHFVSQETVRAVRRAKTWPQWKLNKVAYNRRRVELAKKSINVPPISPATEHVEEAQEDLVTIPRELFNSFVLLGRRITKLEQWRDRQLDAEKSLLSLALNDEPKVKRPFWSKR